MNRNRDFRGPRGRGGRDDFGSSSRDSFGPPSDDFGARLESARALYLPGGVVSAEQVKQTFALIRMHQPLPVTSRVPSPEEILHLAPLRRAVSAPAAR